MLEAGGDALIRLSLHSPGRAGRAAYALAGAAALFCYGVTVNRPEWAFGRVMGVYIVFFFLSAQLIGALMSGAWPSAGIWLGGALIIAGGVVMTVWR